MFSTYIIDAYSYLNQWTRPGRCQIKKKNINENQHIYSL